MAGSSNIFRIAAVSMLAIPMLGTPLALCTQDGIAYSRLLERMGDTNILYTLTVSSESAVRHAAHVRLTLGRLERSSITLEFDIDRQARRLGLAHPARIWDLRATNENGEPLLIGQHGDERWPYWRVLTQNVKTLTIDYDIAMDYYSYSFGGYLGFLGKSFGMSMGIWTFLAPKGYSSRPVLANFSLPMGWNVYAPWEREGDLWYAKSLEYFVTSTFALGEFRVLTRQIRNTFVSTVLYGQWPMATQDEIAEISFRIFEYYSSVVFRECPIDKYMAIYSPTADDGRLITNCEWSQSQGLSISLPFRIHTMIDYAHRVFHIWNVFPPTGMEASTSENDWSWWTAEGIAIYYNNKVLVDLGYWKANWELAAYFERYVRTIVGTELDLPLHESWKALDIYGDYRLYNMLAYWKGAFVSFLMDNLMRKLTNGNSSLDNLMRVLYEEYGNLRGVYSNRDIKRILNSVTHFDFTEFFNNYVYGNRKLPLLVQKDDLIVDWPEFLRELKLSRIPLMTLSLSLSSARADETVTVTVKLVSTDGKPIVNQTINVYLNSTVIGSAVTNASGLAALMFKPEVSPGTYQITSHFPGSSSFSSASETATLLVSRKLAATVTTVSTLTTEPSGTQTNWQYIAIVAATIAITISMLMASLAPRLKRGRGVEAE